MMNNKVKLPDGFILLDWSAIPLNKLPRGITDRQNSNNKQRRDEVAVIYETCRTRYCINANGEVLELADGAWLRCHKHHHTTTNTSYYTFSFRSPHHKNQMAKLSVPMNYFSFQTYNYIKKATEPKTEQVKMNLDNEQKLRQEIASLKILVNSLQLQVSTLNSNLKAQKETNNKLLQLLQQINEISGGIK